MLKYIFHKCKANLRKLFLISLYFLFHHRKALAKLSSYGFSDIKVCRFRRWQWWQWHNSREKNYQRFYYKAKYSNKIYFIKVSKDDYTVKNEIFINEYLIQCGVTFAPKLLMSDENYGKNTAMIAFEFISEIYNFELADDEKAFEFICKEFEYIHGHFLKFNIIHGDISASNLLLGNKNNIVLIDFALSWVPGSEVFKLRHPCGLYHVLSDNKHVYDNAFSFLRMLDDCGISDAFKQKECYKRIEKLLGVHTYSAPVSIIEEHL